MSKIIGKYEFEDVTKDFEKPQDFGWINILPSIEYRHKYWYMWEFEFMWWKSSKRIQITRTDWNKHQDRDEKLFWKRLIKKYKDAEKIHN